MKQVQLKVNKDGTFEMRILEHDKERWRCSGISSVIIEDVDGVLVLDNDGWHVFIEGYSKEEEKFVVN